MKIGIIAAMEEELQEFKNQITNCEEITSGQFKYYKGTLHNHEVFAFKCGIGKVNAAIGTTLLIDKYSPEIIINTGVAGGFCESLNIGDIVVSTEVRHHDADVTIFNYEMGQIPDMPAAFTADDKLIDLACGLKLKDENIKIVKGAIASGDSFIHNDEQIEDIQKKFPSIHAAEMEAASIAQTCYIFNLPFLIIRSISDVVHETESNMTYEEFMPLAADNSFNLVFALLKVLKFKQIF
jgi:adenosylhomocysteine nucleosidase